VELCSRWVCLCAVPADGGKCAPSSGQLGLLEVRQCQGRTVTSRSFLLARDPLGLGHRAASMPGMHWHCCLYKEGVRLCDKVAQRNRGRQRNPSNPVREGDTLPQLCPGCHWLMAEGGSRQSEQMGAALPVVPQTEGALPRSMGHVMRGKMHAF